MEALETDLLKLEVAATAIPEEQLMHIAAKRLGFQVLKGSRRMELTEPSPNFPQNGQMVGRALHAVTTELKLFNPVLAALLMPALGPRLGIEVSVEQ